MNHLVGEHPIRSESLRFVSAPTWIVINPPPLPKAMPWRTPLPLGGGNAKQDTGEGKMAIVGGHRPRRRRTQSQVIFRRSNCPFSTTMARRDPPTKWLISFCQPRLRAG